MEQIGRTLKERRERLGLTLEEVERSTRMRTQRLEALEEGRFDTLPSQVQLHGFLRNYADFLGLDADDLLANYQSSLAEPGKKRSPALHGKPRRTPRGPLGSPARRRSLAETLLSGIVIAAVAAVFLWGGGSIVASLNMPETPDVQPVLVALNDPTETPTLTPSPEPNRSLEGMPDTALTERGMTLTPTLILPVLDSVRLELTAVSETWVRLSVDGEEVFQGRMAPGDQLAYTGQEKIELVTGNAGGLRVVFNGQDQGPLGDLAQVVERVWSPRGIVTPTATITLTPTLTPQQSPTFTPTSTSVNAPTGTQ